MVLMTCVFAHYKSVHIIIYTVFFESSQKHPLHCGICLSSIRNAPCCPGPMIIRVSYRRST
jgi:hypothetical protein